MAIALVAFYRRIQYEKDVETALKLQLWATTILQTVVVFIISKMLLPDSMVFTTNLAKEVNW